MAVTILNPARFNDDGGLGTRRYIRAAFFDEGYGSSTSFYAYRRGGGIVPDTASFSGIGLGTAGSPLRMSQFSGFTVPSRAATVTTGSYNDTFGGGKGTEYYTKIWTGFNNAQPESNPPNFGSISGTVKDGYTTFQCYHYFASYEVSPTETEFTVNVTGNLTGSYSLEVDGTVVTSPSSGLYFSGPNTTYFNWTGVSTTSPFGSDGTTHTVRLV